MEATEGEEALMGSKEPPAILPTSALAAGLDAFAAVRAAQIAGVAERRATFELSLDAPDGWGFLLLAGVEPLLDALERYRAKPDELQWLESTGAIDTATRKRLADARFACDVDAAPEGTVVFHGETVLTVEGPFWQAQLVGALAASGVAQPTLVATKFARATMAARPAEVIESGSSAIYRLGGSPTLARAAFIGGAAATTFALAGKRYGIPVHALEPAPFAAATHDDARAKSAWLEAAGSGAVLRVADRAAIEPAVVAARTIERSTSWEDAHVVIAVSGDDRVELAREVLAAFATEDLAEPMIVAAGDLDERDILDLVRERAPLRGYVLSPHVAGDPARLARYELVAIEENGSWTPRTRRAGSIAASPEPGRKVVLRYFDAEGHPFADVAHLTNERLLRAKDGRFLDRATGYARALAGTAASSPLHSGVMRAGKRVAAPEPSRVVRERAQRNVAALADRYKRLTRPARYPVGMTARLAELKAQLLE
jgi:nicotinate phosphoribosyltransferase